MKTIWKFENPIEDKFSLKMPYAAEILSAQIDQRTGNPCIWAIVETDNEQEERTFVLYGTGNPIENYYLVPLNYIGTYQYNGGNFVGHVFEFCN